MTSEIQEYLQKKSHDFEDTIISYYQHIHKHPEIAFEEENTARYIEKILQNLGLETKRAAGTGVIATLKGTASGKTIALRADIDALAIKEETDLPFASHNDGKMHACGHDAHSAMLLGAAHILVAEKEKISGTIKFIFQPAEEFGGGAKRIVDEKYLDDVDAVFGIHVWSDTKTGSISLKKGPLLASSDNITIIIKGAGGHAAMPDKTIDPTAVMHNIYNAIQLIITREIDPFENCVISIPVYKGSEAHNIIPSKVEMKGTLRTFNKKVRDYIIERIKDIVKGYSEAWRCTGKVIIEGLSYPPLINDPELTEKVMTILPEHLTSDKPASLGSEDFSCYTEKCPGVFIIMGTYNEEKGCTYPHHHPKFKIDENILSQGAYIYSLMGFMNSLVDL